MSAFQQAVQGVSSSYQPKQEIYVSCPPPVINVSMLPPAPTGSGGSGGGAQSQKTTEAPGIFTVDFPGEPHAFLFSSDDLDWKQRALDFEGEWMYRLNSSGTLQVFQDWLDERYPEPV